MIDDLVPDYDVPVPPGNGLGYLLAGDHDAHPAHLVHEASEGMTGTFGLLLVLGVYLDGDWKYLHAIH